MAPSQTRMLALAQKQCFIFAHTYNPTRARLGTKVLRQRLRGPSVADYYPRQAPGLNSLLHDLRKADPTADLDTWDDDEEQRLEDLTSVKARGKGAPKKKRSKEESKNVKGAKKKVAATNAEKSEKSAW